MTTWGWIHVTTGVIVLLVGFSLVSGQVWARTIGVIIAAVSVPGNSAWLAWYPFWLILTIAVGISVIWVLSVHGRDVEGVRSAWNRLLVDQVRKVGRVLRWSS